MASAMKFEARSRFRLRRVRLTHDRVVPDPGLASPLALAFASVLAAVLSFALAFGCGPADSPYGATQDAGAPTGDAQPVSPDAKIETYETLRADLDAPRHASDGGGRAWLIRDESGTPQVVSSRQRLEIVYEAGPEGIAQGGLIFLQPSPFWGWDGAQIRYPEAPGYTEVSTEAEGVELQLDDTAAELLAIQIEGRALAPGERVRIVYGAGAAGTRIDRYAEDHERIFIAVDGDGDGIRSQIEVSPSLDIHGGLPMRLQLTLQTTAVPGERVRTTLAVLDHEGNPSPLESGEVSFLDPTGGLAIPERVVFDASDQGSRNLMIEVRKSGVHRLQAIGHGKLAGLSAVSNPLVVAKEISRQLWGDLHGHSQLSDGTGTPDQYFAYARDVAALDVAALTDHDHWGMSFLDAHPALWQQIRDSAKRHHVPGQFVTLLGYEWTSWLHGHRHVLYFRDEGEIYSSVDPRYERPDQLWAALRGQPALTFAHHSAGGPVATNWYYPPDPELEPVTEIVSVHGSSESADSPGPIYSPVRGNYVRDALDAGYRFGFIGSGDSHDGHPGLVQIATGDMKGGLAAILASEPTRAAVLEAMRARRVYATNGPRIYLRVSIDGQPMGSALPARAPGSGPAPATATLQIDVVAAAPLARVDLIRSGQTAALSVSDGALAFALTRQIPALVAGEYQYVRVVQTDGGAAWSSPIFAQ